MIIHDFNTLNNPFCLFRAEITNIDSFFTQHTYSKHLCWLWTDGCKGNGR